MNTQQAKQGPFAFARDKILLTQPPLPYSEKALTGTGQRAESNALWFHGITLGTSKHRGHLLGQRPSLIMETLTSSQVILTCPKA